MIKLPAGDEPVQIAKQMLGADLMPSGGDAKIPLHLHGRNSLFRIAYEGDGKKPRPQGKVRIVHDRARGYGGRDTAPSAFCLSLRTWTRGHTRTSPANARRPAHRFHVIVAFLLIGKVANHIYE